MKRLLVLAMALATSLTAISCSDSTSPQASLSGTYTLRSVNGSTSSPWLVYNGSYADEVLSSTITLDAQGNYSTTTYGRTTYPGSTPVGYTDTFGGYWTLSGSTLTLVDTYNNVTYYATVSGSDIIINASGLTQIYSK